MRRRTSSSLLLGLCVLTPEVAAETPDMDVQLTCRPEAAPGRVLCELSFRAAPETRLTWADALVTASPDFARPLRARITPERFKEASATERKLSLAFVATRGGVGSVTVRARAVVCRGRGDGERCLPESRDVSAELRVGS